MPHRGSAEGGRASTRGGSTGLGTGTRVQHQSSDDHARAGRNACAWMRFSRHLRAERSALIREEPHRPAQPLTADVYTRLPVFDDFVRLTIQHLIQLDLDGQGDCFADEVAVIRNRGPHGGVALLPGDAHASWRQAFFQLQGPDEPPPVPTLVGREIGSGLVPGDAVQIGAPALKDMNGPDHSTLLFSMAVGHQQPSPNNPKATTGERSGRPYSGTIPASFATLHPLRRHYPGFRPANDHRATAAAA